ncbi:hypothetical protein SAY87_023896 [Trapa incisa]|uniref:Uncharacterized protein n=1 Tax=Trapa incisa TaxID=236973 RepID=A0AAN7KZM6_9MYRT|nr:hypothetical protein SAY87_023896 [Trapa incisa]
MQRSDLLGVVAANVIKHWPCRSTDKEKEVDLAPYNGMIIGVLQNWYTFALWHPCVLEMMSHPPAAQLTALLVHIILLCRDNGQNQTHHFVTKPQLLDSLAIELHSHIKHQVGIGIQWNKTETSIYSTKKLNSVNREKRRNPQLPH